MAKINGLDIHYEIDGEGTPVVLVHGLGATSNVWHAQRLALRRSYRVIVYDRSGSGRSQRPGEGHSVEAWTEELAGLLDQLEIPTAVVVGHSLGSMIALRFAGTFPDRTRALILAGGEAELTPEAKAILTDRARRIESEGLLYAVEPWLEGVLSTSTREANPALAGLLREMFLSNDARSYARSCLALRDGSARGLLAAIRCPTLLLVGDRDPVTPLSWQRTIASEIADSRIKMIPRTSHMTMLESPDVFNTAFLDFLAGIDL